MHQRGTENGGESPPTLSRFCPRDEYLSTFDMLQDDDRNEAYSKAVRLLASKHTGSHIDHDDTKTVLRWLDIGTGSGLLACLVAAAATADSPSSTSTTEVYACEGVMEVADVASETLRKNCFKKVNLFRGHSMEMEVGRGLPSRVHCVVSELLGTGLLEEGVLPTLRDAKARLLQPGFASIPCSAEVWAFCCESSDLERMSRLSNSTTGGSFRAPSSERWMSCPGAAAPASMHARPPRWGGVRFRPLSPSVRVFDFDFADLPGPSGRKRGVRFPVDAAGTVHAVVCWWRCFMDEGRTVVMSTSPEVGGGSPGPRRDHWRQSVYLLNDPVVAVVEAGDAVRAVACHDDSAIWFNGVECDKGVPVPGKEVAGSSPRSPGQEARETFFLATEAAGTTGARAAAGGAAAGEGARASATESSAGGVETPRDVIPPKCGGKCAGVPQVQPESALPPVCLCGLHRTCPPIRIWMLNDEERTAAFRSVVGATLSNPGGGVERQGDHGAKTSGVADGAASKDTAVCACVSHGFLLPLLAAQEGASVVLEIPPSATAAAVYRDVYRANGIADSKVQPFSDGGGGLADFYDILSPPPGSADAFARIGKLDAVIGEPYFADLSSAWPFESLLLFWCVRTALEAGGCFSPRTRVVPARARLLACPFACDVLFRGRRRVGTVEGIDMSAVNGGLGCTRVSRGGGDDGGVAGGRDQQEESEGGKPGAVESVRLQDYHHVLLGPPTAVLDMDLTRPLCDLRGGRVGIVCRFPEGALSRAQKTPVTCHGVALWLDIWLDEGGCHRLSTGPEASYWPQGLLFFEEGWSVVPCGRSFHLEASLEDGALKVDVS